MWFSESGGWSVDPGVVRALRLKRAMKAMADGDPDLATVEAEELLDESPDHIDALVLVGDASLENGETECALEAFQHVLSLSPADPRALTGICITHFELGQLETCVRVASSQTAQAAGDTREAAEPWYYMGLALERLGREAAAAQALARAAELKPEAYPLIIPMSDSEWEAARDRALQLLPDPLRRWLEELPIEERSFPELKPSEPRALGASPIVPVRLQGEPPPLTETIAWELRPSAIVFYRRNVEQIAGIERLSVTELLAASLRLETLEWLGLPEDALPMPEEAS